MNTYKEYYQENVVPALMERFKFKSNMEAPRLIKITLNMGLGSAIADKKDTGEGSRRVNANCRTKSGTYICKKINRKLSS